MAAWPVPPAGAPADPGRHTTVRPWNPQRITRHFTTGKHARGGTRPEGRRRGRDARPPAGKTGNRTGGGRHGGAPRTDARAVCFESGLMH